MRVTPVVYYLLVANGLMFVTQLYADAFLIRWFALWPLLPSDQLLLTPYGLLAVPSFLPWQLVSYAFLHGGGFHLLTNMFGLWMFGSELERYWGSRRFGVYFAVCVIGAGLVQLVVSSVAAYQGSAYPTIGASGGVFGILLAFGMTFPNRQILLLIPPIPMKAKWFVIAYGLFELWAGITGSLAGIAHFAHLGGMAFGFFLLQYWRRR